MYITNPVLPYCAPLGTNLSPGSIIRINGTVSPYATTFAINLQCGSSVNPRDDVALHLSPVFSPPPRIVRNSIIGNRWGPEESFGGFPLAPGSPFEFMILVEPGEFKIALNGNHFTEFRHRLPFERITHIAIDGDATINIMACEGSPYASASAPPMESMSLSGAPPYPPTGSAPPPYPMGGGLGGMPGLYPPLGGSSPYGPPPGSAPYAAPSQPYVPQSMPYGSGYPASGGYPAPGGYPTPGGYPGAGQPSGYPGGYPSGQNIPPPPGYPQGAHGSGSSGGGIGGKIGAALGGLGVGAAATSIGSTLFGNKNKSHSSYPGGQGMGPMGALGMVPGVSSIGSTLFGNKNPGQGGHKSKPIPIGTIAAGAGAAALGAAVLTGHHPFKKAKKLFKHKHKFGKFKHKGWHHKGWSSSSSSSSEEEE